MGGRGRRVGEPMPIPVRRAFAGLGALARAHTSRGGARPGSCAPSTRRGVRLPSWNSLWRTGTGVVGGAGSDLHFYSAPRTLTACRGGPCWRLRSHLPRLSFGASGYLTAGVRRLGRCWTLVSKGGNVGTETRCGPPLLRSRSPHHCIVLCLLCCVPPLRRTGFRMIFSRRHVPRCRQALPTIPSSPSRRCPGSRSSHNCLHCRSSCRNLHPRHLPNRHCPAWG